jgi:hypothetical protein
MGAYMAILVEEQPWLLIGSAADAEFFAAFKCHFK